MESFWAHFKGEKVSLFLEAATLEELEWVIGKQIEYYNCPACSADRECRHTCSRPTHRDPLRGPDHGHFI